MSGLFEQLLKKRGFSYEFLNPKYEECFDPFLLPDMEKAVDRIKKVIENKEKILVYGDYDVDGVTATTIMFDALKMAGVPEIITMLPDRFLDGYGMSKKIIQKALEEKIGLVVTVDCGSGNDDIVEELFQNGIGTIVTDHHECPEKLPEKAVAVVNPKRKDFSGPKEFRDLAGAGVAFEFARALVKGGFIPDGQEKWLLDLAAVGTICDSMPMSLENRRICYFGMKVLSKTRRVGLKELMRSAGVKTLNSEAIGFQIGPRLNAAGRMASPNIALNLLMTDSRTEAAKLVKELEDLNTLRRVQQGKAVEDIEKRGLGEEPVIVEVGKWHEGILGIIAGKLTEKYKKPAFVLSEVDGVLKGSGRSFGDFSLAEALSKCQNTIISGGGHAAACGVKVTPEKIDDFRGEINDFYRSLNLKNQEKFLDKEEDLEVKDLGELSLGLVEQIGKLEPFGEGNEEPVFLLKDVFVLESRRMGTKDEHIRLQIRGKSGNQMKVVAFYAPEEWLKAFRGQRGDIWVSVCINEWNGARSVEGRILKMRLEEADIF